MWGAGVGVVLAAVSGVLTGELAAGWPWWVADAVVVLASAALAVWLASGGPAGSLRLGAGALFAGRDLRVGGSADLRVRTTGAPPPPAGTGSTELGPGAVNAGRDLTIDGDLRSVVDDSPPGRP